jgi:hypothetical protein
MTKSQSKRRKRKSNSDLEQLAARIKALRLEKGKTNYEYFAYDNEIPRAQYGRYEKCEDTRYSSLLKIIRAHELTLPEFFSEGFK